MNIATHICTCYPCWRGAMDDADRRLVFECRCRAEQWKETISRESGIVIRELIESASPPIPDGQVVIVREGAGGRVAAPSELDVVHTPATLPWFMVWSGARAWVLDRSDCRHWRWYLHEVATTMEACLAVDGPEWPGSGG